MAAAVGWGDIRFDMAGWLVRSAIAIVVVVACLVLLLLGMTTAAMPISGRHESGDIPNRINVNFLSIHHSQCLSCRFVLLHPPCTAPTESNVMTFNSTFCELQRENFELRRNQTCRKFEFFGNWTLTPQRSRCLVD